MAQNKNILFIKYIIKLQNGTEKAYSVSKK